MTGHGIAVVARDTWSAIKGRQALQVSWDEGGAETRGTPELSGRYRELARSGEEAALARQEGDAAAALSRLLKSDRFAQTMAEYSFQRSNNSGLSIKSRVFGSPVQGLLIPSEMSRTPPFANASPKCFRQKSVSRSGLRFTSFRSTGPRTHTGLR